MDAGNQLRQPWRAPGSASSSSRDGGDSSSSHRGYHGSMHNPAKRVRNGVAYRDDETTGYEDDGSEQAAVAAPRWNGTASMGNNSKSRQAMGVLNGLNPLGMKTTNTYASPSAVAASGRAALVHGSSRTGPSSETYWTCMWRKPQAKKHKTWESDGILVVENGTRVSLRDKDNSSVIARGNVPSGTVSPDAEFSIGGKEVMVDAEFPAKQYLDGSCFGKGIAAMVQQGTGAAVRAPTASASSFYGARPSAVPKKFVSPSMTIPRESAYSTTKVGIPPPPPASLAPSAADSFYGDTENSIALNARFPGGMGYRAPAVTSKTAAATHGLGKAPPAPKSLHDPNREGAVVMKRPDEQHEKMFNKKGYPVVDVVIDPHIGNRLREHQKEGVKFMYEAVMGMKTEGQGCILADDMGLGKTIQSIALMHTLLKQSPYFGERSTIQRVLIACPVTLVNNWAKEITKWLGRDRLGVFAASGKNDIKNFARNRGYHVLIIGYEKLRTVVDDLKNIQPPIGLIICDEGHRLKSAGAKTTQALHSFNVKRRIILSGTPIQNELSEFHAMVDFVNPGLLDSYNTFKKTFEQPILKAREPRCPPDAKELGEARSEALQRITKLFVLRRLSDIIANYLPSKAEYVVFVAPTPIQIKFYQHVIGSDQVKNIIREGRNGLILIDLLRKVCNTPGLLLRNRDDGANHMELVDELMQVCPIRTKWTDIALSGKLLAVKAILDSLKQNTDEKVVVVSSFVQTLNILEQMCMTSRFSFCRLDGATKQCDRQDIVDGFNKSSQQSNFVFLLSSKAGGTGLNIIGASRLILFDSDWNPSNDLQAMARIHREGQKRKCVIYRLLTKGTMDEKIYQRQITKTGLAGSLMDDGGGMSKESKGKDAFTTKDLRDIFTLHTDTNSQTHDLLECSCADGDVVQPTENEELLYHSDGGMSSDSDDGNDSSGPDRRKFMKASQYQPSEEQEAKARKKLQALKEYTHIDCGLSTSPESAIDGIEDDVLRVVAEAGLEALRDGVSRKWNAARQFSPDDNDEEASTAVKAAYRGPTYEGGEISFVFHKKTNKPTKATTEATIE